MTFLTFNLNFNNPPCKLINQSKYCFIKPIFWRPPTLAQVDTLKVITEREKDICEKRQKTDCTGIDPNADNDLQQDELYISKSSLPQENNVIILIYLYNITQ